MPKILSKIELVSAIAKLKSQNKISEALTLEHAFLESLQQDQKLKKYTPEIKLNGDAQKIISEMKIKPKTT